MICGVTVAVIGSCMTAIICLDQGGSKRESEIEPAMCAAANDLLCSHSSALIHIISDIYNLALCK